MIAFILGIIVGLMVFDYITLRANTIFGQRAIKSTKELSNMALHKYKLYYEDIRLRRAK